jgi:hypothetical protein
MFKPIQKENLMNKLFQPFVLLAAISVFAVACNLQAVQAEPEEVAVPVAAYQTVLGKSLNDKDVADFIANNNCSSASQFQLCKDAGMALWINASQIVQMVYLYAGISDGFKRYRGKLPFGLSFYDPMWKVEEKLREPNADDTLQRAGLPDEMGSPDHIHYWAIYNRLNMTVIYNSPGADEDAYIYAILVNG